MGSNLELADILVAVYVKLREVQGRRGDFLRICGVRKCWTGNFLRDLRREMVEEKLRIEIERRIYVNPRGARSIYYLYC